MIRTLLLVVAFLIGGCDKTPGTASAGADASAAASQASSIERTKALTQSKTAQVSIKAAALPLVADAVKTWANLTVTSHESEWVLTHSDEPVANMERFYRAKKQPAPAFLSAPCPTAERDCNLRKLVRIDAATRPLQGKANLDNPEHLQEFFAAIENVKPLQSEDFQRYVIGHAVAGTMRPVQGYSTDLCSFNHTAALDGKTEKQKCKSYAAAKVASANLTNAVFSLLAAQLTVDTVWSDPDAIAEKVKGTLDALDKQPYLDAWLRDRYATDYNESFDLSGRQASPISFVTATGLNVQQGATGVQLRKSGAVWFGENHISGKQHEIALASMVSKSAAKATTDTQGTAITTQQTQGASAAIK